MVTGVFLDVSDQKDKIGGFFNDILDQSGILGSLVSIFMFFNEGVYNQRKILDCFLESQLIINFADLAAENSHEAEFFLLKKVILAFRFYNFSDELSYGGAPEVFYQDLNIVRMEELEHLKSLEKYLFWSLVDERCNEFREVG